MISEYLSLMENETWELVPPPEGQNVVGSHWVMKVKHNEDGSVDRYKARLVAQTYSQTKGTDCDEVFSPVARHTSLRTLLALTNVHDLEVHQMDVKMAFLNEEIDCDIYMSHLLGARIAYSELSRFLNMYLSMTITTTVRTTFLTMSLTEDTFTGLTLKMQNMHGVL